MHKMKRNLNVCIKTKEILTYTIQLNCDYAKFKYCGVLLIWSSWSSQKKKSINKEVVCAGVKHCSLVTGSQSSREKIVRGQPRRGNVPNVTNCTPKAEHFTSIYMKN